MSTRTLHSCYIQLSTNLTLGDTMCQLCQDNGSITFLLEKS